MANCDRSSAARASAQAIAVSAESDISVDLSDGLDLSAVCTAHLYQWLELRVSRLAALLLGSSSAPSDLVHDAVTEIVLSLPRYKHSCAFTSWVHAIVLRHVHKWIRGRQRLRRLLRAATEEVGSAPVVRPDDAADTRQALDRLTRLLRGLPERQRVCLLSIEVEGLSCEDIAARLRITPAAVRAAACRARASLRKSFDAGEGRRGSSRDRPGLASRSLLQCDELRNEVPYLGT